MEFKNCPDREELLINCGNFHYEIGEYLNAISNYTEVTTPGLIPYSNIALCYLHLVEPWLTSNYIQLACQQSPDTLTGFNRDVIDWIYSNNRSDRWNSLLPCVKQDLFYERQEYGTMLLDKVTLSFNQQSIATEEIDKYLTNFIRDQDEIKFKDEWKNVKFKKLRAFIEEYGKM